MQACIAQMMQGCLQRSCRISIPVTCLVALRRTLRFLSCKLDNSYKRLDRLIQTAGCCSQTSDHESRHSITTWASVAPPSTPTFSARYLLAKLVDYKGSQSHTIYTQEHIESHVCWDGLLQCSTYMKFMTCWYCVLLLNLHVLQQDFTYECWYSETAAYAHSM